MFIYCVFRVCVCGLHATAQVQRTACVRWFSFHEVGPGGGVTLLGLVAGALSRARCLCLSFLGSTWATAALSCFRRALEAPWTWVPQVWACAQEWAADSWAPAATVAHVLASCFLGCSSLYVPAHCIYKILLGN